MGHCGSSPPAPPLHRREPGWAGVALAPGAPSKAAVARHFAKDVTLFDGPMAVRSIHTLYRPTAVQLLSSQLSVGPQGGPLVAVTEGPQLSIWDVRGHGRGARVAKLSPGPHHGHLYCVAASDDGGLPLIGAVVGWEAGSSCRFEDVVGSCCGESCRAPCAPAQPTLFVSATHACRRGGHGAFCAGVGAAQVGPSGPLVQLPQVRGHRPALFVRWAAPMQVQIQGRQLDSSQWRRWGANQCRSTCKQDCTTWHTHGWGRLRNATTVLSTLIDPKHPHPSSPRQPAVVLCGRHGLRGAVRRVGRQQGQPTGRRQPGSQCHAYRTQDGAWSGSGRRRSSGSSRVRTWDELTGLPVAGLWWCDIPGLQQLHPLCLLPTRRDGSSGGESGAAAAGGGPLGRGVSFRGDSRWVGLAKAAGQDIVAGMTQSCQLYVAEFECR